MKKLLSVFSVLIVLSVLLISCGSPEKEKEEKSDSAADVGKYNSYVGISNYITGWLESDIYGYIENFGFEEEIKFKKNFDPKKFEGMILTPIIKGGFDQVEEALAYTSKKPSFGAADESMKILLPKMKEYLNTINEVDTYYRSKAFAEDNFAKGKELHKKFYAMYNEYRDLADKFFIDFSEIEKKRQQVDLEKLKKADYLVRYYAKSIVIKAKEIQSDFALAKVNDSNILDFDANKYKERYDSLTEDMNKFLEYAKDKSRLEKEGIGSLWRFDGAIPEVKASATDIMQVLQTKSTNLNKPSDGKVKSRETIGYLENYNKKVSNLISCYNNMIK
ncbi:DUF3829 domain-containing protein [Paenibacillus sp. KN14-4R]|uniref:DUF3829 domain-containing protein n=1 Tax=Paenibacillus sp. KN14-4R TaxID=3445773 RepID=UPI003F9EC3D8